MIGTFYNQMMSQLNQIAFYFGSILLIHYKLLVVSSHQRQLVFNYSELKHIIQ